MNSYTPQISPSRSDSSLTKCIAHPRDIDQSNYERDKTFDNEGLSTAERVELEAVIASARKEWFAKRRDKDASHATTEQSESGSSISLFEKRTIENAEIQRRMKKRNAASEKRRSEVQPVPVSSAKDSQEMNKERKVLLPFVPHEQLGLLAVGKEPDKPLVDVVAVHGLGAIPDITWKEKRSRVDWLSDPKMLPHELPRARILRFGYDSIWKGTSPIRTSLKLIAGKLVRHLIDKRTNHSDRPLIFIGHCLGGLVIQKALQIAKLRGDQDHQAIFAATVGIAFLGTPHRGTSTFTQEGSLLAAIAASSDLSERLETEILRSIGYEDGALSDTTEDFLALCSGGRPIITCFFEQRSSIIGKLIGRDDMTEFIVDERSATLDGHTKIGLEVDHFSLNKFHGPNDPIYREVCTEIRRFYNKALECRLWSEVASAAQRDSVSSCRVKPGRSPTEKHTPDKQYLDRLKRNMQRHGVEQAEQILAVCSLPDDQYLSTQERQDKIKWHKRSVNKKLIEAGLDDGLIDEILNDTGATMMIDGVETTFTKMARKWVSTKTLHRYGYPYQIDEKDKSAIVIKRWVADYEKDFLWDHALALRENKPNKTGTPLNGIDESKGNSVPKSVATPKGLSGRFDTGDPPAKYTIVQRPDQKLEGKRTYAQAAKTNHDPTRRDAAQKPFPQSSRIVQEGGIEKRRASQNSVTRSAIAPSILTPHGSLPLSERASSHGSSRSAPGPCEIQRRRSNSSTLNRSKELDRKATENEETPRPRSSQPSSRGLDNRHRSDTRSTKRSKYHFLLAPDR